MSTPIVRSVAGESYTHIGVTPPLESGFEFGSHIRGVDESVRTDHEATDRSPAFTGFMLPTPDEQGEIEIITSELELVTLAATTQAVQVDHAVEGWFENGLFPAIDPLDSVLEADPYMRRAELLASTPFFTFVAQRVRLMEPDTHDLSLENYLDIRHARDTYPASPADSTRLLEREWRRSLPEGVNAVEMMYLRGETDRERRMAAAHDIQREQMLTLGFARFASKGGQPLANDTTTLASHFQVPPSPYR